MESKLRELLEDSRDCVLTCLNSAETAAYPDEALVAYYRELLEQMNEALGLEEEA